MAPARCGQLHYDAHAQPSRGGGSGPRGGVEGAEQGGGGGAWARTRPSARPEGRAGIRLARPSAAGAPELPSASDALSASRCMCGNNMSAPLPVVVPAARKATAAVSGGGWGPRGAAGSQAAARGCARAAPRALPGRGWEPQPACRALLTPEAVPRAGAETAARRVCLCRGSSD